MGHVGERAHGCGGSGKGVRLSVSSYYNHNFIQKITFPSSLFSLVCEPVQTTYFHSDGLAEGNTGWEHRELGPSV